MVVTKENDKTSVCYTVHKSSAIVKNRKKPCSEMRIRGRAHILLTYGMIEGVDEHAAKSTG